MDASALEADARLASHAATVAASEDADRGRVLGEMVTDAEYLARRGHLREALGLARAVASLPREDDLVDPPIVQARAFLHREDPEKP